MRRYLIRVDRIEAISHKGASVSRDRVWVGVVGSEERRPVDDPETVVSALLPLTPLEWCEVCMREGQYYIGGCCGTTSSMQDIVNGVFRDSGYIDNADLLKLATLAQSHEGFEIFARQMSDEHFADHLARWSSLDPWEKIGLVYQACEPYLKPRSYELPLIGRPDLKESQTVHALENVLFQLSWDDLRDDDERGQRHANRLLLFARALEPARTFLKRVEAQMPEVFEGYAVFERDTDQVLVNGYGQCIYKTREAAEEVIETWRRTEQQTALYAAEHPEDEDAEAEAKEPKLSEIADIRPVRVTVANGVEIRDEI